MSVTTSLLSHEGQFVSKFDELHRPARVCGSRLYLRTSQKLAWNEIHEFVAIHATSKSYKSQLRISK